MYQNIAKILIIAATVITLLSGCGATIKDKFSVVSKDVALIKGQKGKITDKSLRLGGRRTELLITAVDGKTVENSPALKVLLKPGTHKVSVACRFSTFGSQGITLNTVVDTTVKGGHIYQIDADLSLSRNCMAYISELGLFSTKNK